MLRVGVLGPVEVTRDGVAVGPGGGKWRTVLAMLVMHRGEVVPASRLCEALWGEEQPPSAAATVQSHVSRLRAHLPPDAVKSRVSGYRLEMADDAVDACRFEALTRRARAIVAPDEVLTVLSEALALWRGGAYGDLGSLDMFRGEARRLDELRLVAVEEWVEARLGCGDAAGAVGELESLVTEHPLRERFWRQLMTALYRTGRQGDALRRAATLRTLLREELGLEPSAPTRELEARILAESPELLQNDGSRTSRLGPALERQQQTEPTSFVGRAHAVVEIGAALGTHRLVTVTGPGGVGKTRLARRAAAQASSRPRHGTVIVELAPLRDPGGLGQVIATVLDVQQRQHRSIDETVLDFLEDWELLLVLDNCEHVIDAVAAFVERLLLRCPQVTLLATSREPLGLPGEYVHVLVPLVSPTPAESDVDRISVAPAVQLFVDRAASACPGFALGPGNAPAVAEICRRLDGLPLALELAAARLRVLGPAALADRLDQRFQLLGTRRHRNDPRQRNLHDLVEWSYDLLDRREQEVFVQLSVFAGTFDMDAAAEVCLVDGGDDILDVLVALVEKSMVQLTDPDGPRYQLLETLREFGHRRLQDAGTLAAVQRRHLRWYGQLAHRGGAGLDGPDEASWSARLDLELDNFRAAHAFAVREGDADAAAALVADLREQAFRRIRYEVSSWADATLAILADDHPLLPVVLGVSAYGRWVRGDLEAAIERAERAAALEALVDGTDASGVPERVLGNAYFYLGRTDQALEWMDRMVAAAHRSRSPAQLAHATYMRSVAQTSVGDRTRGAALADEAKAASEQTGSLTAVAQAAYALGLALQAAHPAAAIDHLRTSARLAGVAGNRWLEGFALTEVHWLVSRQGDPLAGLRGYADVIDAWYRGGDWANQWLSLRHVFGILIELRAHRPAAVIHGVLAATGAAYALPFEPADARRLSADVVALRELLGPAEFSAATRVGTAMSDGEAVTYVLDQIEQLSGAGAASHPTPE